MSKLVRELKAAARPVPCLFYPVHREMGVSVPDLLRDSTWQAEAMKGIPHRYGVGAVVRMTELWCEAAAFGVHCEFPDGDFPVAGDPLTDDIQELCDVPVPPVENVVTAPLLEAARIAAPSLDVPLIVGVTGPFTLGSVLGGSEDFMMNAMAEDEATHQFLEKITAFLIEYAAAYKALGVSGVMLAEPSVSMISPAMTAEFSNAYIRKLIDAVQDDDFSVLYHNCGAVNTHLDEILTLEADIFHFGSDVDLERALDTVGGDKLVMGNLEPRLLLTGSAEEVSAASRTLQDSLGARENWLLSTGCDLAPGTPDEAIRAFFGG